MAQESSAVATLNYEQAFQELEAVVSALEAGQSDLEEALKLFERGQALARRCAELLDTAEIRVRTLSDTEPNLPVEPEEGE